MAKTLSNVRIYGDAASGVWVAPKGSTIARDLVPLVTPAVELGWLSEDGIGFDRSVEATSHKAYQGGTIVRRKTSSVEDTFKFQCLEETADTLGLYYAGQKATKSATGALFATVKIADQTASDDRFFIVQVVDGAIMKRYYIPVGAVEPGSLAHSNNDMTIYEFSVTIQGDYDLVTNNPSVLEAATVEP